MGLVRGRAIDICQVVDANDHSHYAQRDDAVAQRRLDLRPYPNDPGNPPDEACRAQAQKDISAFVIMREDDQGKSQQ